MRWPTLAFVLALTASPAFATSYARPVRHDVFSRNRAFVLDVDPGTQVHTVYDARDRGTPLWSFSCGVWHFPFLVSDDGRVVAVVSWMHVKAEDIAETDAVTFWDRAGTFRVYPLRDLCPNPPKTQDVGIGPIGDFWRTWYTGVDDHGETLAIRTTCGVEYRFRYADGELVDRRRIGWRGWGWRVVGGVATVIAVAVALLLWRARGSTRPA